jgi:hypothetical protein
MKIPKIIVSGLASGVLHPRPEVMDLIKRLRNGDTQGQGTTAAEPPPPPNPVKAPEATGPGAQTLHNSRRLVVSSPLPGRWIRWSCL